MKNVYSKISNRYVRAMFNKILTKHLHENEKAQLVWAFPRKTETQTQLWR